LARLRTALETVFAALAQSGAVEQRLQRLEGTTIRAHQLVAGVKGAERSSR
jgi:hypothetical protein